MSKQCSRHAIFSFEPNSSIDQLGSVRTSRSPCVACPSDSRIKYQITAGNYGAVFDIDPDTGTVKVKNKLDYENVRNVRTGGPPPPPPSAGGA